jgi:predicted nucleotidyltransferase
MSYNFLPGRVKELSMAPPTVERTRLIAEVVAFVRAAQRLPGITRIALIGSLPTNKADPKDVDLLVTVADDADLAPLANLTRKLQGHAQQMNRGGEVFLADPQNKYLGRICQWKICAPGVRLRCDALCMGYQPRDRSCVPTSSPCGERSRNGTLLAR